MHDQGVSTSLEKAESMMEGFLTQSARPKPKSDDSSDGSDSLPPLEETELEDIDLPKPPKETATETEEQPEWDDLETVAPAAVGTGSSSEHKTADAPAAETPIHEERPQEKTSQAISWDELDHEIPSEEVKEGDPFKEITPPRVLAESSIDPVKDFDDSSLPEEMEDTAREAVAHLFPKGRGTTSKTFVDAVVGAAHKIGREARLPETETPSCPNCGMPVTKDGFEYPPYVFEAMGRARLEDGMQRLKESEPEKAIEAFEKAKQLLEKSENTKLLEEATRRVDEGYEALAVSHYAQAENHLKAEEFEWAVVQFRKAREQYMLTSDAKMRAKCMERVRETYSAWGKTIEDEGDALVKKGFSREALMKYQQAAEKYKLGDDTKRLHGLEKKIRKA